MKQHTEQCLLVDSLVILNRDLYVPGYVYVFKTGKLEVSPNCRLSSCGILGRQHKINQLGLIETRAPVYAWENHWLQIVPPGDGAIPNGERYTGEFYPLPISCAGFDHLLKTRPAGARRRLTLGLPQWFAWLEGEPATSKAFDMITSPMFVFLLGDHQAIPPPRCVITIDASGGRLSAHFDDWDDVREVVVMYSN